MLHTFLYCFCRLEPDDVCYLTMSFDVSQLKKKFCHEYRMACLKDGTVLDSEICRYIDLDTSGFLQTIPSIKDIVHLSVINEIESEEKKKKS